MIGKTIAHYHILEKPGEGGMGWSVKPVTRTWIPCRSQSAATRKGYRSRAQTEIRAGGQGRLGSESPNIIAIYDIDQTDGVDFIVMEYVQGKTPDAVVPRKDCG